MSAEFQEASQRENDGRWRPVIAGLVVLIAGLGMVVLGLLSYPSEPLVGDPGRSVFSALFGLVLSLIGLVTTVVGARMARRSAA